MIKIVTDEDLSEMSSWVTPECQDAPCSNCDEVKKAIKANDMKAILSECNASETEAAEAVKTCMQCIWYWIDEVDDYSDLPILRTELEHMGGKPVYLKGCGLNRWDILDCVSTDGIACFLRVALPMSGCGKTWFPYRREPEGAADEAQNVSKLDTSR